MIAELRDFTVVTKLIKQFKSLYGFGGRCFNIRDVCMDFDPCFKVYNLVSIRPKSMKLGQMTNLNVIFHMAESVYRLVAIRNSPQFPVELRNLQILRKKLDNSSQFSSSRQPTELKNLDVALNIAGVVKIRSENLRLW